MTETENAPKIYGINLNSLSEAVMKEVVKIYQESVGETSSARHYEEQLVFGIDNEINSLKQRGFVEMRLGSTLNSDSKLQIRSSSSKAGAFYFTFNPNFDPQERKDEEKNQTADKLRADFNSKVSGYLQGSGLGVEL